MKSTLSESATTTLTLQRTVSAQPEKVWHAWTDGTTLKRWFGPQGCDILEAELDLKPGGRWRIAMASPDGGQHEVGGRYICIEPPSRLAFTWAWHNTPQRESQVTVELAPADDGTRLTLTHERFADTAARDRHAEGWISSLPRLFRVLGTPSS